LISLPSDRTLWKVASAGFGLICGVAIIALMNQLNYLFYPIPDEQTEDLMKTFFSDPFLLSGKLIAIATGCFFAGAITKLFHPGTESYYAIGIAIILMLPGMIDLVSAEYPLWYWFVSLLIYVPLSVTGFMFIKKIYTKKSDQT
jgi:hypothetical protein